MHQKTKRKPIIPSIAKQSIKGIVTLYGSRDSGKTATLNYVYTLLSNSTSPLRVNGNSSKDFRAAFVYKGVTILLSTVGDSPKDVEENWIWFLSLGKKSLNPNNDARRRPCVCFEEGIIVDKVILVSPTRLGDFSEQIQESYLKALKPSVSVIDYVHKEKYSGVFSGSTSPLGINTAKCIEQSIDAIIDLIK